MRRLISLSTAVMFASGFNDLDDLPESCQQADVSMLQVQLKLQQDNGLGNTLTNGSLVALNSTALAQIGSVTKECLAEEVVIDDAVLQIDPPENATMKSPVLCKVRHKVGTVFCQEFLKARSQATGEAFNPCNVGGVEDDCSSMGYDNGNITLFGNTPSWWNLTNTSTPFRVLHWIRKPEDLILSGYRYHMQAPEPWTVIPGMSMKCAPQDRATIFGVCVDKCSYFQALKSVSAVNESAGVIMEALMERSVIREMFNFTMEHVNDNRVLHLSLDHLKVDYNQTMRCINKFLGGKGLPPDQLHIFDSLNKDSSNKHVTTGKYNNTLLKNFLLELPAWGPEFTTYGLLMRRIFQRQAETYGCPVP